MTDRHNINRITDWAAIDETLGVHNSSEDLECCNANVDVYIKSLNHVTAVAFVFFSLFEYSQEASLGASRQLIISLRKFLNCYNEEYQSIEETSFILVL